MLEAAESSQLFPQYLLQHSSHALCRSFFNKHALENSLESREPLGQWLYPNTSLTFARLTTEGDPKELHATCNPPARSRGNLVELGQAEQPSRPPPSLSSHGDNQGPDQRAEAKGTSCTVWYTSGADIKHLRATSPGGRFSKTSQEPDELLDKIYYIFAINCSFHLNMICLNKQPAWLQVSFHPLHVQLDS